MSNYNIGLSGLNASSEAIDTISNNIANASTVGYKMGDYVFRDQFFRAVNPLDPARAGMGVAKDNIRRIFTQGTVQASANTLDMAITGAMGMFRLASNTASDEVYYTRNGQFAVSRETDPSYPYPETRNYIVNENGHYLTGYIGNGKNLGTDPTSLLTMPPPMKNPEPTTESQIYVNLDARAKTYDYDLTAPVVPGAGQPVFDKDDVTTYTYKTSQTIFSGVEGGGTHTFTTFYRRINDVEKTITYDLTKGFTLDPTSVADPILEGTTELQLDGSVPKTFKRLTPDGAEPGLYELTLYDGTKLTMTSPSTAEYDDYDDLVAAATAALPGKLDFTALLTQFEVYATIDDQVFNKLVAGPAIDETRYSDTTLLGDLVEDMSSNAVGNSNAKPIAVMQFWGGRNIDGMALDPLTYEPTYRTKVDLVTTIEMDGGEDAPFSFTVDLTDTNSFSSPFSVYENSQNGYGVSYLNSVIIDGDGKIYGSYGDGRQYLAGQLALVHFSATNGLVPVGNNEYIASYLSGREVDEGVIRGVPGERGLGNIRASAVEASNVDLANELVKLLIQQRMYSANSQTLRAFDETLTTTIRMTGG